MQVKSIDFLDKLSDSLSKDNRLAKIRDQFIKEYQLTPTFGIEVEFYLSQNIDSSLFSKTLGIPLKPEKGCYQFEVDLPPSNDLTTYAKQINDLRINLQKTAANLDGKIDLKSKPFANDYGNSMHFNLSFTQNPQILEHAAKSLCHFMLDTFLVFMPYETDYERCDSRFMAPTHISYGGNNRTTALRIPESTPLRLEHRISSPLVDPYLVMTTILTSVLKGLKYPEMIGNFSKIYGNAYDSQYKLTPLPKSIDEAVELFRSEFFDHPF